MKKILFVLLFLSGVAYSQTYDSLGTVITSKMTTGRADSGTVNDFPTHISTYGMGGFQEVANTTSRNNIAPRRRKLGMIVYTRADSSFWQLRNDTSNANWTRLYLASSPFDSANFQKYPDTLTWDATKKNLKDSTASLRTDLYRKDTHVTDSINARNYSNSLYLKNADSTTLKNSINVAGTLSNVAYENQNNVFTGTNYFRLQPYFGESGAGTGGLKFYNENNGFITSIDNQTSPTGNWTQTLPNMSGVFPLQQSTFTPTTGRLAFWKDGYIRDTNITYQNVGISAKPTFAGAIFTDDISTSLLNGINYTDGAGLLDVLTNVAIGQILKSNGTGATLPSYDSKVFLYPSDSAFSVTSSIKNKDVSNYLQQNDTSAFQMNFTTGTGKPQFRIKDETGLTTLYIDSAKNISGSEAANGDLTLQGTTNATRTTSYVNLQPNGGFVGIGMASPTAAMDITHTTVPQFMVTNTSKVRMRASSTENGFECWKDATPTKAIQIGMGTQGSAITDDIVFSVYGGVSWAEAARITNTTKSLQMIGKITKYNNVTPPANTVMVGNGTDASLSTSVNIDSIRTRILAFDGQAPGVYRGTMGWDSTNRRFLATSYLVQRSIDLSHAILTADVVDSSNTNEVVLDSIPMAINFPSVGKVVTIHLMGIATVPNPQALTLILRQTLAGTVLDSVRINPTTGVTDKAIDIDVTVTYRVINGASSQLVALMRANVNGIDYASTPQGIITFNVGALNTLYVNAKMSATGNQKVRIRQGYATTIN